MKTHDIFGLTVRCSGLLLFLYGGWNILAVGQQFISACIDSTASPFGDAFTYAVYGIGFMLTGFFLLWQADRITRWSYRKELGCPSEPKKAKPDDGELLA